MRGSPAPCRRPRAIPRSRSPSLVLWLLLGLFVVYPLAMLLARVLFDKGTFSAGRLATILTDRHQLRAFWNSLLLGTLVGIVGTVLGFLFAFTAARGAAAALAAARDRRRDAAAAGLAAVHHGDRDHLLVRSARAHHLRAARHQGRHGLRPRRARWPPRSLTYFPIAYLTLRPVLAAIDSNLEEMALRLGASRWRVFRTVTLPLALPGLANAFLLLFAASLADFATPLILAGNQFPVLPTQAYLQITGLFDLRGGAALSFVLLVPALIVFVLQRYWVSRALLRHGHRQGRRPDAVRQRLAAVRARCSWPSARSVALVIVYLYALLLYASLVMALGANHTFTLAHYHVIFTEGCEGDPRHADHRRASRCRWAASTASCWAISSRARRSSAAARWRSSR